MAAEARRNGSANLKVCTPLERQWKFRHYAKPLVVGNAESAVEKIEDWECH
jgi:hypothetical protein